MFDESGGLSYGSTTVSFAPWILLVEAIMMLLVIMTTTSSMMMTVMTMIMMIFMTIFMMTLPVGYTTADVVYQWTAGRGVNIASDMKLSQV